MRKEIGEIKLKEESRPPRMSTVTVSVCVILNVFNRTISKDIVAIIMAMYTESMGEINNVYCASQYAIFFFFVNSAKKDVIEWYFLKVCREVRKLLTELCQRYE